MSLMFLQQIIIFCLSSKNFNSFLKRGNHFIFYHHRHKLDFGWIVFHLLTDKKSDVPWRYLKYTHIRKLLWLWFDGLLFQFKIQVKFSRSIIVTGGPWLVIGQRVLSLVSHWSSLSLSALMMARWLRWGLEQTATSLTSFTPDSGSTRRETSGHRKNQWFLFIRDTSKGCRLEHTLNSSWYSLLKHFMIVNFFKF